MPRWCSRFLNTALLLGLPLSGLPIYTHAQSFELQAISDFTNRDSGAVPYYLEIERNSLAINAANPDYRNLFARAEHEYLGPDGLYDITIHALGEIDGDGTYRLSVNDIVQGVSVNPPVTEDYTVIEHTFTGIALTAPVTIAIESNAVSNNMIPEGDGYAFARGRWRAVTIEPHVETPVVTNAVDLGISLSTVDSLITQGNTAPMVASVINHSDATVASASVVKFALSDAIQFYSSDTCTANSIEVRCALPELAPGEIANAGFLADINDSGWLSISASVSSDQVDSNARNNVSSIAFEALAASTMPDNANEVDEQNAETEPTNSLTPSANSTDADADADDSSAGSTSTLLWLTLFLGCLLRIRAPGHKLPSLKN